MQHRAPGGEAVGGYLNQELGGEAFDRAVEDKAQDNPDDKERAVDHSHVLPALRADEPDYHRLEGGAGHGNRDEGGGDKPFPFAFQDAGAQHGGHIAAQPEQGGYNGKAVQAQAVHDVIHQDSQPGQVAGVFHQPEHEIEGNDVGQHHGEGDVEAAGEQPEGFDEVYFAADKMADNDIVQEAFAPHKGA
ncbi:hypothetical protein ES708_20338 [subsurface metagenome]